MSPQQSDSESPGSILVTGTSSGIGRATAGLLADLGFEVLAGRRGTDSEASAEPSPRGRIIPLQLDVTLKEDLDGLGELLASRARSGAPPLIGLVSNAGAGLTLPVEYLDEALLRQQLELNLVGHVALARRVLPPMREALAGAAAGRRGRLLFVGTGAGIPSPIFPFLSSYMAAKWGLEAVCRSLRMELRLLGDAIDACMINPGFVSTAMSQTTARTMRPLLAQIPAESMARYGPLLAKFGAYGGRQNPSTPEQVARRIAEALLARRPRPSYRVGRDSRRTARLARLPLQFQEWILSRIYR
jgi:NAD(P)-dependent dehydrogenase (short-subunit alcohol dehydrogenase family)